ncbi:hypothetical protein ACFQV2_37935 [Actinokineospora soli]|uniref:NAD dependent epimerase/dehydratase family protein n=1 Tax=Actinokineospora soli TaxID=1048753 RepID=A0ABW2TZM5_9PSEU
MKVDRDAADGLSPLSGESFDAVVDVAPISYPWVRRALDAFPAAGHWTFVSSISAYAHPDRVDDVLLPPRQEHHDRSTVMADPDAYGSIKVASENAVLEAMGDRAFVVRAGLITGPGDLHDRFGYWPARLSRGGRVAVPDVDHPAQIIDVGDLAAWIVDAAEKGTAGCTTGSGPPRRCWTSSGASPRPSGRTPSWSRCRRTCWRRTTSPRGRGRGRCRCGCRPRTG